MVLYVGNGVMYTALGNENYEHHKRNRSAGADGGSGGSARCSEWRCVTGRNADGWAALTGQRVELHGLNASRGLNGKFGIATHYVPGRQRYLVKLEDESSNHDQASQ